MPMTAGIRRAPGALLALALLAPAPAGALTVHEVEYASQADLKVLEVDYASQAGWNGPPRGLGIR